MSPSDLNLRHIAYIEIGKIFNSFHLDNFKHSKQKIIEKFLIIQSKLRVSTKYRNPAILIPLIIYIYFILNDHKVSKSDIVAVSELSSTDFNDFILQLKNYLMRKKR